MNENNTRTPENADDKTSASAPAVVPTTEDKTSGKRDSGNSEPPTPPVTNTSDNDGGNGSGWTGKAALVLSLIAICGSAYVYWDKMQADKQTQALEQQLQQQLNDKLKGIDSRYSQRIGSLNSQVSDTQAQLKNSLQQIDKAQQQFANTVKQINANTHTSRKDWQLAEAEYLLRIANQRVLMEHTPKGALEVMREADKLLRQADDAALYQVRKRLAHDIAALEAVPDLDREGLFLRLDALNEQVDQLQLISTLDQEKAEAAAQKDEPVAEETGSGWTHSIKTGWHWLGSQFGRMFYVHRRDKPIEPLISPEQEFYLKQALHLQIEQAQLALLNRQQPVFDAAIDKAITEVDKYFNTDNSHTKALVQGLEKLKGTQIDPELPAIDGSLNVLKEHLAEQARIHQEARQ